MFDHQPASDRSEPVHYSEVIEHDEILERLRVRIREIEQLLGEGAIQYGDEQFTELAERLDEDWPYVETPVKVFAKLRALSSGAAMPGALSDDVSEYFIPDSSQPMTAWGVEIIPIDDTVQARIVYMFSSPGGGLDGSRYYCFDEDIFSLQFAHVAEESLAWQLERLVPDVVAMINSAIDPAADLTTKVRGLDSLKLSIDPTQFGDYDIVEKLAIYLNNRMGIDHRVMHSFVLEGSLIARGCDDENDEVAFPATITAPLTTPGYFGAVELTHAKQQDGTSHYIPWLTLYAHTERLGDDNDDILHMPASTLREAYCLRPEQSLVRRLAAKAVLLSQLVQEPSSDIEMAVETPMDRELGYYETMRYLQTLLDGAYSLARTVAEHRYDTAYEAATSAEKLLAAINEILANDWDELRKHTFVAEGIGIKIPCYQEDGYELDDDDEPTGRLSFTPDQAQAMRENILMEQYFVSLDGFVPYVIQETDEAGVTFFTAYADLCAGVAKSPLVYRQAVPGTDRVAREYKVSEYVYVPLDSTATLKHIDLYDLDRFATAMERFERKLQDTPKLRPSFKALRKLQRAMYHEREDGVLTPLNRVELLTKLGRQGSRSEVAATLIVDTLSDLLGRERIVSLIGEVRREDEPTGSKAQLTVTGVVVDIVSTYAGSATEEPMLVFIEQVMDNQRRLYVPLAGITEFHF